MEKDIKEQLEKLQYYGEFYAKSDIDDKIKLEELDKTGEISEFGRNFSPQVDHKYTMVISDRRSYLLGNGRGGKDFTNFLTTLEKLDNEKYLGLRESLETDPARYHIYTHRGDLLEAFDGVYDEELNTIGNNFGEVYNDVNNAIKRGEVDLSDYPDLERAFDDYELKILDKEIWERDNNYVKFYMDNAYEYLNEKNVLLEEAKMLDAEKHKNVGADMKTVNDGSLLDGLPENVSIPESEKVAGGLDKEAVDYKEQVFINGIMDSDDKYKSKQVYFVNKNEFSTMDFIDDGFDDTYIKLSDGEKVLVGPYVNNSTEEDLAKFTAQASLYGEFSRNDKYQNYNVGIDPDYGVRLTDKTKNYKSSIVVRPDECNKDSGNFDMRFELSNTYFTLLNDDDLLSSIMTDDINKVKHNFIEDVRLRSFVNYDIDGVGRMGRLPRMLSLGHDDFHVFGVDLIDRDRVGVLIKHEETEDNNIKLDVNFTNYECARIRKKNVCNGRLTNVDFDTKVVYQVPYDKEVENVENYKHIVTQKFKSYPNPGDAYFKNVFGLDVDDFASFVKVVSKEDFERQCLDGTLFNNELDRFLENSFVAENRDLINSFGEGFNESNKKVNCDALDEFLLDNGLVDDDLYRNAVNNKEQDFINVVNSVTNKEQDKGMER